MQRFELTVFIPSATGEFVKFVDLGWVEVLVKVLGVVIHEGVGISALVGLELVSNACLPGFGLFEYGCLVQCCQLALGKQRLAGDPDIGYLIASSGVDYLRDGVIDRLGCGLVKVNADHVGDLAGLDRP